MPMPDQRQPRRLLLIILLLAFTLSCRFVSEMDLWRSEQPTVVAQSTVEREVSQTATPSLRGTATPDSSATRSGGAPTETVPSPGDGAAINPTWAPPALLPGAFDGGTPTTEQQRAAAELQTSAPPERDDVALAMAYGGVTEEMLAQHEPLPTPQVGDSAPFNVLNIDSNFNVPITARLYHASEHAYFWFDSTLPQPAQASLQEAGAAFDQIYERNVANFGPEIQPGIDGDGRLHVLNASPGAICNSAAQCGLLGYFSSSDALPRAVNEYSNERDMFVMNGERFGTITYIHVLAHEFRHMIEDNYDRSDADWEVEGSAMLAEDLAGYSFSAIDRGNAFLANPDQQLNRWSDGNTYAHYGQGYVLNRYIYDRLGPALFREFAMHKADGLQAVTVVAQDNGLALDGESLWLDWLVALAIHRHPQAASIYRLGDGQLDTAAMTTVANPTTYDTRVHQYASDYYRLEGDGLQTIAFAGSRQAPLLGVAAASADQYWYAHRVNYSHMQLQREFDLSEVTEATLNYSLYYDIERGYDFAYVSVSEDGGLTWQGLEAAGMQGLSPEDDPGDAALTARFYTGRARQWVDEQIDLTPFAGKVIQLRFSYVTDPILTFGGFALDNISIPEVGFYDDAERDAGGWLAQGFTRTPATLAQNWRLILITYENGAPVVTALEVDETGTLAHTLNLSPNDEAILIVAATAPMTLESAPYRLQFSE